MRRRAGGLVAGAREWRWEGETGGPIRANDATPCRQMTSLAPQARESLVFSPILLL